jgi:hypothetical protein
MRSPIKEFCMTRQYVDRAVDGFAAEMKAALLKRKNMARQPQWPELPQSILAANCGWKAGLVERALKITTT